MYSTPVQLLFFHHDLPEGPPTTGSKPAGQETGTHSPATHNSSGEHATAHSQSFWHLHKIWSPYAGVPLAVQPVFWPSWFTLQVGP